MHLYRLLKYNLSRHICIQSQVLKYVSLTLVQSYSTKLHESLYSVTCSFAFTEIYQVCNFWHNVHWFGTLQHGRFIASSTESNSCWDARLWLANRIYPLLDGWESVFEICAIIFGWWPPSWWKSGFERACCLLIKFELLSNLVHISGLSSRWLALSCSADRVPCEGLLFLAFFRLASWAKINFACLSHIRWYRLFDGGFEPRINHFWRRLTTWGQWCWPFVLTELLSQFLSQRAILLCLVSLHAVLLLEYCSFERRFSWLFKLPYWLIFK